MRNLWVNREGDCQASASCLGRGLRMGQYESRLQQYLILRWYAGVERNRCFCRQHRVIVICSRFWRDGKYYVQYFQEKLATPHGPTATTTVSEFMPSRDKDKGTRVVFSLVDYFVWYCLAGEFLRFARSIQSMPRSKTNCAADFLPKGGLGSLTYT